MADDPAFSMETGQSGTNPYTGESMRVRFRQPTPCWAHPKGGVVPFQFSRGRIHFPDSEEAFAKAKEIAAALGCHLTCDGEVCWAPA